MATSFDTSKDVELQLMDMLIGEEQIKKSEDVRASKQKNAKIKPIPVEKIFDENQFVISIGTYGWNGIITLLGIDNKSEIVSNIENTINEIRSCSKKVSGKFLSWFQIGGQYFLDSSNSKYSARGEIIMTEIFRNLLNKFGMVPALSSKLCHSPCATSDQEFRFFMNNWGTSFKFGDNMWQYFLHKMRVITTQVGDGTTFFMEKIDQPVGEFDMCCISIKSGKCCQIVCPEILGDEIIIGVESILKTVFENGETWSKSAPKEINGWSVYQIEFGTNLFEGRQIMREGAWSKDSTLARLLYSRLATNLTGWSLLVNGAVKLKTDSIWLIKDLKSNSKSALPTNQLTRIRPHLRDESAAIISLHEIDLIRCFKFSKNSISAISTIMSDNCEVKSFVESKDHEGCHEWKINEEPWSSWGTEAIKGRIIIMKLIAKLFEFGYEPVVSLCACRNISRKDSISFYPTEARKDNSKTLFVIVGDTQCLLFCGNISKSEENCIQEALKIWPYGLRKNDYISKYDEFIESDQKCYFVDFINKPWSVGRHQSSHGKLMIQALLVNLKKLGWRFLTSAKLTGECTQNRNSENNETMDNTRSAAFSFDTSLGCHTLFFIKHN